MNDPSRKNTCLKFLCLEELSLFKKECACNDFYVDRDALTLVGTFTPEHVQLAINKYNALCDSFEIRQ